MNKPNLRKLLKHLEKQRNSEQAARFNMRYWGSPIRDCYGERDVLQIPVCNTQSCLAGETTLAFKEAHIIKKDGGLSLLPLSNSEFGGSTFSDRASNILGLDSIQEYRLFYLKSFGFKNGWPKRYENMYKKAKTPKKRLDATIARLKHFIKTNGAQ